MTKMIHLSRGPGTPRVLWCVLWQQLQVLQGDVGHVSREGGAIVLKLVALRVRDARGPTATQHHAVQPLVLRLEHGKRPVHLPPSRQ
jgi:hypothetical protein